MLEYIEAKIQTSDVIVRIGEGCSSYWCVALLAFTYVRYMLTSNEIKAVTTIAESKGHLRIILP
jgi:hypothetical protein